MRFQSLLLASSLASLLPLAGHAQTTPHLYVGAGANLLTNAPFGSKIWPRRVGPSLTAGWQFTPQLAVQVSAAYQWNKDVYSDTNLYSTPTSPVPSFFIRTMDSRYSFLTIPVLLRYTFSSSTEGLHFDALGGVALVHSRLRTVYSASPDVPNFPYEYSSSDTRVNLTLGPAVRYAISPQVELTANGLVSAIVSDSRNFSDRLFLNVLVGAQYNFGSN
jgi:hypothetical protein